MAEASQYATGGHVQASGGIYLERAADAELLRRCCDAEFVYILSSRQMGKSSLMIGTSERLLEKGVIPVIVDLQRIGNSDSKEQWYFGVVTEIAGQLELTTRVQGWWAERGHLPVAQRLNMFLEEVVLTEVPQPVVIFVDEIDQTLDLDFTDDFFAAIRYLYVARAYKPELKRLSFVLIGVATPASLIKDSSRTPFNIGHRLEVTDFTESQARPLADGLGLAAGDADLALREALRWTGGHPYLTLRLFRSLADQPPTQWDAAAIQSRVEELFLRQGSEQDDNIRYVRQMLTDPKSDATAILTAYIAIRSGRSIADEERSAVNTHLKLAGVVRSENGFLRVRNPIYERVFDAQWARQNLPRDPERVRRLRRLVAGLTAAAAVLVAVIIAFSWLYARATRAERSIRVGKVVAQADLLRSKDPGALNTSMLLGIESLRRSPSVEAYTIVRESARLLPIPSPPMVHETPVLSAVLSPDGRLVATRPEGRDPILWEAASGRELFRLPHGAVVNGLAFSPDGKLIATAGADRRAVLWDTSSGSMVRAVTLPEAVNGVAFTPDGATFATASDDHSVALWDTGTGAEKARLRHNACVFHVAFNEKGDLLASAGDDGARIWNLPSGSPVGLVRHEGPITWIGFQRDALVSVGDDRAVRFWDPRKATPISVREQESPFPGRSMTRFPARFPMAYPDVNGGLLAFGYDTTAQFWFGDKELSRLIHEGTVTSASNRVDSAARKLTLLTSSTDRTARLWHADEADSDLGVSQIPGMRRILEISRDGKWAFGSDGKEPLFSEAPFTSTFGLLDPKDNPVAWDFSPDGSRFAALMDGRIKVWDLPKRALLTSLAVQVVALDYLRMGGRPLFRYTNQAIVIMTPASVEVWDPSTGKRVERVNGPTEIRDVLVSPDGRSMAIRTEKDASIWRITGAWKDQRRIEVDGRVGDLAFTPDSTRLVVCSNSRSVQVVDPASGQKGQTLSDSGCNGLAFDAKGQYLAVATGDDGTQIWRWRDQKKLASLLPDDPGASRRAESASFSADGRYLLSWDGSKLHVWDFASRIEIARISPEGPSIRPVFAGDGSRIYNGARLLMWQAQDVIREACKREVRPLTTAEWSRYFPDESYSRICPAHE